MCVRSGEGTGNRAGSLWSFWSETVASSLMHMCCNFNYIRCTHIQAVSTRMPNQMRTWYNCKSAMYPLVQVWILEHLVPSYAGRFINSVTDLGGLPDTSFRIKIQKDCFPCRLISPRCKLHFACSWFGQFANCRTSVKKEESKCKF